MRIGIGIGEISGAPADRRQSDRAGAARRARRLRQRLVRQHLRLRRDHGGGAVRTRDVAHRARHRGRADLSRATRSRWRSRRCRRRPPAAGRFALGIGLSHQIVIETMLGLSFAKPYSHMREYLAVLAPLIRTGSVSYQGEEFRVNAQPRRAGRDAVSDPGRGAGAQDAGAGRPRGRRHDHLDDRSEDAARAHHAAHQRGGGEGRPARRRASSSGLPVAVTDRCRRGARGGGAHLPDLRRPAVVPRHARPRGRRRARRRRDRRRRRGASANRSAACATIGVTDYLAIPYPIGKDGAASVERTREVIVKLIGNDS